MGLFDGFKRKRELKGALTKASLGNLPGALAFGGNSADRFAELAEALLDADMPSFARAAAERAVELQSDHWNARIMLAEALVEDGEPRKAIALFRALQREQPSEAMARRFAPLLLDDRGYREAVALLQPFATSEDPRIPILLGKAHLGADDPEAALDVVRPVVEFFDRERKRGWTSAYDDQQAKEATALYDEALSRTAGHEQVVVDHARRGQLDARAGVNFSLLAAKLMVGTPRIAVTLDLLSVEDQLALAEELLEKKPGGAPGLCQQAMAELRRGNARKAETLFAEAREADGSHFGALFGFGAARMEGERVHLASVSKLPELAPPKHIEKVVGDWNVLTPRERKVVVASVAPLAAALPLLVEKRARAKLLPVDARPIDLTHFAEYQGEKIEDDPRTSDSVDGVATEELAVSNIVSLMNLSEENGLVFAHEFAHLVHYSLPEHMLERIKELHRRALKHEWAWKQYQLRNEFEFFAVAYTDYLLHSWRVPLQRAIDDAGEMNRVFAFFDGFTDVAR